MAPVLTTVNRVEASMATQLGEASISHRTWSEDVDFFCEPLHHTIQFQLLPRFPHFHDSRASFPTHWKSTRFESIGAAFLIPANVRIHFRSKIRRANTVTCNLNPQPVQSWFD